jgi:hypothetical protein
MDSVVEWRCRWVPSWLVYKWVGFMSDMRMSCRCVSLSGDSDDTTEVQIHMPTK